MVLRVSAIADVVSRVERSKWVNILTAALAFRKVKQKGKKHWSQPEVQPSMPTATLNMEIPRVFSIDSDDSDLELDLGQGDGVPEREVDSDGAGQENMVAGDEWDMAEVEGDDEAVEGEEQNDQDEAGSDDDREDLT